MNNRTELGLGEYWSDKNRATAGGIAAVIMAQVVIIGYAIVGFTEKDDDDEPTQTKSPSTKTKAKKDQ